MTSTRTARTVNVLLWITQVGLAGLFLFAGFVKLHMPAAALTQFTGLPGSFLHFVAVAEIAGALGLILPGLLGIQRRLTPAAAAGLVAIMAGAVTVTLGHAAVAQAVMPFVAGILAGLVAYGRRSWAPRKGADPRDGAWVGTPTHGA